MEPVDPAVFAGHDPQWRGAWEERLDADSRRQVTSAIKDGSRLDDPALEPFLHGLIARRRRQNRWRIAQGVFTLALLGAWVIATTVIRPSLWSWFYIASLLPGPPPLAGHETADPTVDLPCCRIEPHDGPCIEPDRSVGVGNADRLSSLLLRPRVNESAVARIDPLGRPRVDKPNPTRRRNDES